MRCDVTNKTAMWLSLFFGIFGGFLMLAGLYYWVERNDPGQAAVLIGCAVCNISLIGSTVAKRGDCSQKSTA